MGVDIDPELNVTATQNRVMPIHTPGSKVEVWVVPTDEGVVAAREAARLMSA